MLANHKKAARYPKTLAEEKRGREGGEGRGGRERKREDGRGKEKERGKEREGVKGVRWGKEWGGGGLLKRWERE